MESKTEPLKIVDLLAYQEYKLAVLYNEFGHKFPEHLELWAKMVVDELEHQKLVRGLGKLVDEGKLYFNAMILKVSNIEHHLRSIEREIEKAKDNDFMTINEALNIAIGLENSLLDQNIFTFFSGDSAILNNALQSLTRDTQKHHLMLIKTADSIEGKGGKKPGIKN